MKRLLAWWHKRQEERAVLCAKNAKFIKRALAIQDMDEPILKAIKAGDLARVKELRARQNALPCPMCGRTS
jgi:hypothetical protein